MTEAQQPSAKTKPKAKPKAKKAAKAARTPQAEIDAAVNAAMSGKPRSAGMPPVEEGRKRFYVDLQVRHAEWLERYAHYLGKDKRRPMSPADALEHIIRNTYAIDPTKAGLFNSAATIPSMSMG